MPMSGIVGFYGKCVCDFMRNWPTFFQRSGPSATDESSGYFIVPSALANVTIFFILAILIGMQQYLILVSNYPLLAYKNTVLHRLRKRTYGCLEERWGEGIIREFGVDMYKLLNFKWITNKDHWLYSTRNSAQCYVTAWMGEKFGGEAASLLAQTVKHLPAMWETRIWSLGQEDPLEKETATHSSTLAWKIPWTEEPGRLQSVGSQRVRHDWATSFSLSFPWGRMDICICMAESLCCHLKRSKHC